MFSANKGSIAMGRHQLESGTDPNVVWWQDRLTPTWKRLGGGCHLNRAIGTLIEGAGFQFDRIETGYMRGPKPMAFMYEGLRASSLSAYTRWTLTCRYS